VDSHGRTGGHPKSLVVTLGDVIERINEQLREEMEAIASWDKDYWNYIVTDESGTTLGLDADATLLTNEDGEFIG
jgi:hypothetical protein